MKEGFRCNVLKLLRRQPLIWIPKSTDRPVGFGGSVTLKQMGLYELLSRHNQVYWHLRVPEGEQKKARLLANGASVYLSSVNVWQKPGK